jgi:cytoskeleton-associated protein 5
LDEVSTWLNDVITDLDAEVFVRAVGKKAWGEKNFQVRLKPSILGFRNPDPLLL